MSKTPDTETTRTMRRLATYHSRAIRDQLPPDVPRNDVQDAKWLMRRVTTLEKRRVAALDVLTAAERQLADGEELSVAGLIGAVRAVLDTQLPES